MLADYPPIQLEALAELRNAFIDAAPSREKMVELLAAQITDPTSVQMAYQEVVDYSTQAEDAIRLLLREHGELTEAQFSRDFGAIRQMGPAKLDRESPWLYPESVAELLYYYGLVGRGFKGAGQRATTIVYIPSDVAPWLPHPQSEAAAAGLPVKPVAPPPVARLILADDSFLEDAGTLLGLRLHRAAAGHSRPAPILKMSTAWCSGCRCPSAPTCPSWRCGLPCSCTWRNRLHWLRRDAEAIQLTQNPVAAFLDKTRTEQRQALFEAWRLSPDWNDLCRTPELECADTGVWRNDPLQTRESLLRLLAQLQPGSWYSQADVIRAVKEVEPDFQRPTGNYDTWYIRHNTTQEFLKGFEQWDAVEGALLRFFFGGRCTGWGRWTWPNRRRATTCASR